MTGRPHLAGLSAIPDGLLEPVTNDREDADFTHGHAMWHLRLSGRGSRSVLCLSVLLVLKRLGWEIPDLRQPWKRAIRPPSPLLQRPAFRHAGFREPWPLRYHSLLLAISLTIGLFLL